MINETRVDLSETIKLLFYKENSELLEQLWDDETVFKDPLLFAYFNSQKEKAFPKEVLYEIVQGYLSSIDEIKIEFSYNKNDIAYIPQLGYYEKAKIKPYEPILNIGDFEIIKEVHPLLEKYFVEYYRGKLISSNPKFISVWKEHYSELETAINIIKEYLSVFYQELKQANTKIFLHDNPKILNFTTVETFGMLYFYVIGKNNLIYFIEELIHQGSHNYMYLFLQNRKTYFKIDVDNILMRELTGQEWDYRNVYGAFHGLVTIAKRLECFDILLQKHVFKERNKHELLGRLTDQFSRYNSGLDLLTRDKVYTQKGIELYNQYNQISKKILHKYSKLQDYFDLSHRDLDFRYEEFCKLNSYEEFLKNDKQGLYNF